MGKKEAIGIPRHDICLLCEHDDFPHVSPLSDGRCMITLTDDGFGNPYSVPQRCKCNRFVKKG